MRVKLVDPLHPITGLPLRSIGLRADGSPLWPLCGADGEGDEGEEGDDEGSEDDESEDDADDEGKGADDDKKSSKKKSGPVSRAEFDALTNRLRAADKRRADAEKKANELQKAKDEEDRKGKPELDLAKKDLAEITKAHESLQNKFTKLARTNAFLTASAQEKITWHDPDVARRSADLEDLEIDDDGNVEGIREAVKALAKKHAYLVNTGKKDADDDEEDKGTRKRGASGSGVGSVKNGKTTSGRKNGQLSDEQLRARFPALKR